MAWIGIETSLGAITSIRSFVKETPREPRDQDAYQMPEAWPADGNVELKQVSAEYDFGATFSVVLRNITLSIPGEAKVHVVGRTGSGISSMFAALLDCLQYDGSIKIGGKEIREIPRRHLRSQVIGCPQGILTLPGTVRQNLMPWTLVDACAGEIGDADIGRVLQNVGILDKIEGCDGIDADMETVVPSEGEAQLFSIARTILAQMHMGSRVILLDEVTSHLDAEAEAKAVASMRAAFDKCTVLAITHRSEMLDKADLILDVGRGNMTSRPGRE